MREETGCDGVAVGRAAQGNPWIFAQIRDAMQGRPISEPDNEEKLAVWTRHLHMLAKLKGEAVAPFVKCGGILSAMSAACATRRGFESGSMRLPIWKN